MGVKSRLAPESKILSKEQDKSVDRLKAAP
jgi:hypothetical protein